MFHWKIADLSKGNLTTSVQITIKMFPSFFFFLHVHIIPASMQEGLIPALFNTFCVHFCTGFFLGGVFEVRRGERGEH